LRVDHPLLDVVGVLGRALAMPPSDGGGGGGGSGSDGGRGAALGSLASNAREVVACTGLRQGRYVKTDGSGTGDRLDTDGRSNEKIGRL
jgi:hypothetical protein